MRNTHFLWKLLTVKLTWKFCMRLVYEIPSRINNGDPCPTTPPPPPPKKKKFELLSNKIRKKLAVSSQDKTKINSLIPPKEIFNKMFYNFLLTIPFVIVFIYTMIIHYVFFPLFVFYLFTYHFHLFIYKSIVGKLRDLNPGCLHWKHQKMPSS